MSIMTTLQARRVQNCGLPKHLKRCSAQQALVRFHSLVGIEVWDIGEEKENRVRLRVSWLIN